MKKSLVPSFSAALKHNHHKNRFFFHTKQKFQVHSFSTTKTRSHLEQQKPAFITVAITGDVADKSRVSSVPLSPQEQINSIVECYEAGATMVHVHVRDPNNGFKCAWNSDLYQQVMLGVQKECPDMIFQASTGNYGPTFEERAQAIWLKPESASLTPGSVNLRVSRPGSHTYKEYFNSNRDIEQFCHVMKENDVKPDVVVFDLSHIYYAGHLVKRGLLQLPIKLMFVLGGHMALEPKRKVLDFLLSEAKETFGGEDNMVWTCVGVGPCHTEVQQWTLELGGHPRTGFEDTLMIERGVFAKSNAELVKHVVKLCDQAGRPVATPEQARKILSLDPHYPKQFYKDNKTL